MPRKIEISHKTIIFIVFLALGLWVVFQIRDILLMVFVSLILTSALNPLIDLLEKLKLPRVLAIVIAYLSLWLILGLIVAGLVPALVIQTRRLILRLPEAIGQIDLIAHYQQEINQQILNRLATLPENILKVSFSIFNNLVGVLTTLAITFYILLERSKLKEHLAVLFGKDNPAKIEKVITQIETSLGWWVRGELVLMLVVGTLTYLGLLVLGIESALPLAIIAGLLEIIPTFGPTISMFPAVLIALTMHPFKALAVVALYYLVQLFENNILVPNVMRKAAGVNPLMTVLGLMIGLKLAGPIGAVLAIPVIIIGRELTSEILGLKKLV